MATNVKRLQRSAVVDSTPQNGNLVKVKEAKFLTLVGSPANQTGFKVVRSDTEGEDKMTARRVPATRRTRRSDVNPVLRIAFPAGYTGEEVAETLEQYGMEGYNVSETDGVFLAVRSDVQSIAPEATTDIKLTEDGIVATVTRAEAPAPASDVPTGLTLVSMEFNAEMFTVDAATEWLQRNSVDIIGAPVHDSGASCIVAVRSDIDEGAETRRVELESGVMAVITRSAGVDVPEGMVAVVNEYAYGSYGWGQLDFNSALADREFTEKSRAGLYLLDDILRDIMYYSPLPIDLRKTLVTNALLQFGAYVNSLMDALPRQVLVAVARSDEPKEKPAMSKEQIAALTREDVVAIVAEALATKAAETPAAEPVQRSDDTPAESAAPAAAPAAEAAPAATQAVLTRDDLQAVFADAVKPLVERMDKLEGTTLVRSDAGDPEAAPAKPEGKQEEVNVFRGAIPGLRGRGAVEE